MLRSVALAALFAASAALAGDVRVRVNVNANVGWQFPVHSHRRAPPAVWVPRAVWVPTWYVPPPQIVVLPAPAAPPQVVVFERPAPPPPPAPEPEPEPVPQVVVVHVAPEPTLPVPPVTIVPVAPAVPGPDVYSWTDEDGVVNYSTRVPADAKKRAKKLK